MRIAAEVLGALVDIRINDILMVMVPLGQNQPLPHRFDILLKGHSPMSESNPMC
jgi:hypothetical protein